MRTLLNAVLLGAVLATTTACGGGAILRPVQFAFEDRTSEQQITDNKIYLAIVDRWRKADKSLLLDVAADVWEGRVLLTGTVDSADKKAAVAALAAQDDRIVKVYNEVEVASAAEVITRREAQEEAKENSAGQTLTDFWVEQKISARLIGTKDIKSVNYRWRSVKNKVYVIGRAATAGEKTRVLDAIRTTSGVERVKEYIWVK